ncbi:MAG: GAF domain-containing protein [Bryobacteraceae bacterium]
MAGALLRLAAPLRSEVSPYSLLDNLVPRNHTAVFENRLIGVLGGLLVSGASLWWLRERSVRRHSAKMRKLYGLGAEIFSADSPLEILHRVSAVLPGAFGMETVHLYLYSRGAKKLERLMDNQSGAKPGPKASDDPCCPRAIAVDAPSGTAASGAATCFHNQAPVAISGPRPGPFARLRRKRPDQANPETRRSGLLFVPMLAQGEPIGVLQILGGRGVRAFSGEEQAIAQHVANQLAIAIRGLQQRSIQEQLFRSEKLAAMGRLISDVVNDLHAPLKTVAGIAQRESSPASAASSDREWSTVSREAGRALEIVARLVSFARGGQAEARPVDVNRLLRNLAEFRELEWKARGIQFRNLAGGDPLHVLGSQGQLEQVFLNLLVHAEQSLAEAGQKNIVVRSTVLARRLLVEIAFSHRTEERSDPFAPSASREGGSASDLSLCRSIVAAHGGELRSVRLPGMDPTFEIELPLAAAGESKVAKQDSADGKFPRRLTTLVIEPDGSTQQQLVSLLSARGHRVVPVRNSDEALDLVRRMRFDIVFCADRLPGLNWIELMDCMHAEIGCFVLLSETDVSDLTTGLPDEIRLVLSKPVLDEHLERILDFIQSQNHPFSFVNV